MNRYAVLIEATNNGYSAHVPDLPGCVAAGTTLEETRQLIKEAIQFHLEGLRLHGYPVPVPVTVADTVEAA
jgi:predicted RNase H-like HicB family nuclease